MGKQIKRSVFESFFRSEKNGGILLLIAVGISLIIANTALADSFSTLLQTSFDFAFGYLPINYSVSTWINDGLMAIFFLLVGLEIKREVLGGELSTAKKAALPIIAAMGGMLIPALIYFAFNQGETTASGWGIPMATDIAFALAIIAILGKNVPPSLKIFLAALAIADDLGAILVIAMFYTSQIHWNYILSAGVLVLIVATFNFLKLKSLWFYLIPGVVLWYFMHHSGVHATIAGVVLAFCIPTAKQYGKSPLVYLEHKLIIPVNFLIMPIFALANTNITFQKGMVSGLASPLGLGIIFGLFFGKTIGITLFSNLAIKFKLANYPTNSTWKHITGIGMLAGIGFTMSIFISMLSFSEEQVVVEAKFAILCASLISGIVGFLYLRARAR